jgi:hypothetical protein
MPIFSYFLVVGSVLIGLLLWFGNEGVPNETTLASSQMVGITKFKPEPEDEHARATAVNFAAPYKRSERKSVKTAEAPLGQKVTTNYSEPQRWSSLCRIPARQSEHSLVNGAPDALSSRGKSTALIHRQVRKRFERLPVAKGVLERIRSRDRPGVHKSKRRPGSPIGPHSAPRAARGPANGRAPHCVHGRVALA